eukprot:900095-Pleurochrysis_carterae.AAC.1
MAFPAPNSTAAPCANSWCARRWLSKDTSISPSGLPSERDAGLLASAASAMYLYRKAVVMSRDAMGSELARGGNQSLGRG